MGLLIVRLREREGWGKGLVTRPSQQRFAVFGIVAQVFDGIKPTETVVVAQLVAVGIGQTSVVVGVDKD